MSDINPGLILPNSGKSSSSPKFIIKRLKDKDLELYHNEQKITALKYFEYGACIDSGYLAYNDGKGHRFKTSNIEIEFFSNNTVILGKDIMSTKVFIDGKQVEGMQKILIIAVNDVINFTFEIADEKKN